MNLVQAKGPVASKVSRPDRPCFCSLASISRPHPALRSRLSSFPAGVASDPLRGLAAGGAVRRRSGPGCRGDHLPAGSAARLSGGSESATSQVLRGGAERTARGGRGAARNSPATLIARRHGLLAERRDPWRGRETIRPAGKGFDSGRGRRAGGGARPREAEAPTDLPGAAGPTREGAVVQRAHRWTKAGSGGRSHPASLERPGSFALGGRAGNRGGSRRLGREWPGERATLTPFSLRGLLSPLPFILSSQSWGRLGGGGGGLGGAQTAKEMMVKVAFQFSKKRKPGTRRFRGGG